MSEDVKPRKFTLERHGHTYYHNKVTLAHYRTYLDVDELMPEDKLPRADQIKVIELEPTMRLMDEMAEVLRFIRAESRRKAKEEDADAFYYGSFYDVANKALEKYKKFKDGLR